MYKGRNAAVRLSCQEVQVVDNLQSCALASARERILGDYVGFFLFLRRLVNSASSDVRILFEVEVRDVGSVTIRNIYSL